MCRNLSKRVIGFIHGERESTRRVTRKYCRRYGLTSIKMGTLTSRGQWTGRRLPRGTERERYRGPCAIHEIHVKCHFLDGSKKVISLGRYVQRGRVRVDQILK